MAELAQTEPAPTSGSTDVSTVLIAILVGVVILLLVAVAVAARRSPSNGTIRPRRAWRDRARQACDEGRVTIDLTSRPSTAEAGSGLSPDELSEIGGRLDLLIAQLHDVALTSPSEESRQAMRLAAEHAVGLKDAIETERRIRLAAVDPDDGLLDLTMLQLVEERVALDRALHDVSRTIAGAS